MVYRLLADLTVVVHFAYVACVVLAVPITIVGGLLQYRPTASSHRVA
jgi:hypothetical protein